MSMFIIGFALTLLVGYLGYVGVFRFIPPGRPYFYERRLSESQHDAEAGTPGPSGR